METLVNNTNTITKFFDHLRFDFNVRGIIIYNGNASCQRVEIVGYPYVRTAAVNDNEVKR